MRKKGANDLCENRLNLCDKWLLWKKRVLKMLGFLRIWVQKSHLFWLCFIYCIKKGSRFIVTS